MRARRCIEEHILVEPCRMRRHIGVQAHRIVQPRLDMTRAVGSRTVKRAHAEADRLDAALEVRAHGRREKTELIFIGRLHTDDLARCEDKGAQVERRVRTVGRNVVTVRLDHRIDRLQEALLRKGRHLQIRRRVIHARRIEVGTERHNMPVHRLIGLQPLKDLLAVLQNPRTLADRDRRVGAQTSLVPLPIRIVRHITLRQRTIGKPQILPVQIRLCHKKCPLLSKCTSYHSTIAHPCQMDLLRRRIQLSACTRQTL